MRRKREIRLKALHPLADVLVYIDLLPSLYFGVQPALKSKLKFIYLFMRFGI